MDPSQTPTLEDLARLLETASGVDHHPETVDTARWLIEQSAGELYSELVAKSGEEPAPMELARLLCAGTSYWGIPEALDAADWLVAQSELASGHQAQLEQLAADAGTPIGPTRGRVTVLNYQAQLDRLLAAVDDWQDPSDVLDPTRFQGFNCRALHNLCRARIEASDGDARRKLEAVRDKLKRPAELQRLLPIFNRRFELLREWLAEVGDPETAADSLTEMGRLLRSALGSQAPEGRGPETRSDRG